MHKGLHSMHRQSIVPFVDRTALARRDNRILDTIGLFQIANSRTNVTHCTHHHQCSPASTTKRAKYVYYHQETPWRSSWDMIANRQVCQLVSWAAMRFWHCHNNLRFCWCLKIIPVVSISRWFVLTAAHFGEYRISELYVTDAVDQYVDQTAKFCFRN